MTAPTPHGYPDFQRQTPSVDTELVNTSWSTNAGPLALSDLFVGNYEAIGIKNVSTLNSSRLELLFSTQANFANIIWEQDFDIAALATLQTVIPVAGPYCRVIVTNNVTESDGNLIMWAAPRAGCIQSGFKDNVLIVNDHTSLAAGNTVPFNSMRTWPGPAVWTSGQDAGAYEARLQVLDYVGNVTTIGRISDSAGKLITEPVYLPNGIIRVLHHNASASAANVDCFLVAKPYEF